MGNLSQGREQGPHHSGPTLCLARQVRMAHQEFIDGARAQGADVVDGVVWLPMNSPGCHIHAHDIDESAQQACRQLAQANGVTDRVTVAGVFEGAQLARHTAHKTLIVCDIEGAEAQHRLRVGRGVKRGHPLGVEALREDAGAAGVRGLPRHHESAVAPQAHRRAPRRHCAGGGLRRTGVAARGQARGLAGRIDATHLHRHRGDTGQAQHDHHHQCRDRQRGLDRAEPGVTGYTLVLSARLMMLVSAPTIESPVTTL